MGRSSDPSLIFSSDAGIFTAPVRGAYYFRFNGWEHQYSSSISIELYHNNRRITQSYDTNDNVGYVNVSNGFVLHLEKGDMIYLVLTSGWTVYDNVYNRTTFSGFLLFAM